MQRKTYAVIDGEILKENIKEIKKKYPNYEYYIGVVKNNAYHHGIKCVLDLIDGGVNYLAVSSLEEALEIRNYQRDIPILCLEPIPLEYLDDVLNTGVTITVDSLDYLKELERQDVYCELKIHLKIDSGMHRLGFTSARDVKDAVEMIQNQKKWVLEGIYSHFATLGITDSLWDKQVEKFLEITKEIDLENIPMVHFGRSATLVQHPKLDFCNGIRLGIVMYGFAQSRVDGTDLRSKLRVWKRKYLQKKNQCSKTYLQNDLKLKTAFSLYSTIMSVRKVYSGDFVGYNAYPVKEEGYIYTLPIGYADGVTKEFGYVSIHEEKYPIVSDSMDMIMVYGQVKFDVGTKVEIFGKNISIQEVSQRTHQNAYHLLNQISNRVTRVHKNKAREEEIIY